MEVYICPDCLSVVIEPEGLPDMVTYSCGNFCGELKEVASLDNETIRESFGVLLQRK